MTTRKLLGLLGPCCALLAACGNAGGDKPEGEAGNLSLALVGSPHDVVSVQYKVVAAGETCDAPSLATAVVSLEAEPLPVIIAPAGSGANHRFADAFFALPAGNYHVCATPLAGEGISSQCAMAEGDASVSAGVTNEVVLVSQCGGDTTGGLDVVTALNDPPVIDDLDISPSKFVAPCEATTITASASDPDGDAIGYAWSQVSGPASGSLSATGNSASFSSATAGDYELALTVTDANGGSTSLTFPIHVTGDGNCGGTSELSFVDNLNVDDIAADAVQSFFAGLSVSPSDFIYLSVTGPGAPVPAAICMERADFYVNGYLAIAGTGSGSADSSGPWAKYVSLDGGASWSGPDTGSYVNYMGPFCDSTSFGWCAEWGIGGAYNAILPDQPAGESFALGFPFDVVNVTLRVGPSRSAACGF